MTDIVYNKNGIPFDIDALATDVNGKMDKDGINATCPVVISRTPNEQGGIVEIWSDGYCVQTGYLAQANNNTNITISLTEAYNNASYLVFTTTSAANHWLVAQNKTQNTFVLYSSDVNNNTSTDMYWRTEGYIR